MDAVAKHSVLTSHVSVYFVKSAPQYLVSYTSTYLSHMYCGIIYIFYDRGTFAKKRFYDVMTVGIFDEIHPI